ncbi:hypothetical protein DI270_030810 [Microbispora triticiradicis]|uniref:Uncharacterized protein n=1 Tax=Microbispora triticiradicis TaxID=2200763 RepID=A0ABX9LB95_9ACTN|nr:hypothetical protein DI270_030810 [Microbispora triticiradicis]
MTFASASPFIDFVTLVRVDGSTSSERGADAAIALPAPTDRRTTVPAIVRETFQQTRPRDSM